MIGTLFGVAGRRPAHLSTSVIPPRPGNNCRIRRTIALQRTGLTEASYPVSSAVPAARRRLPRREITILCASSVKLTSGAAIGPAPPRGAGVAKHLHGETGVLLTSRLYISST